MSAVPYLRAGARLDLDRQLVEDCVHCGFCLSACPTYALWAEEMDSPRGRLLLMRSAVEEKSLQASAVPHFDRCLGCMACVTACPSGVDYESLIGETRAQVEAEVRRPAAERALRSVIFAVFPRRRRLRVVTAMLAGYQRSGAEALVRRSGILARLPGPLRTMAEIAPRLSRTSRLPEIVPAVGTRRGRVGLLLGCVQGELFPQVNVATAAVLAAEGFDVVVPPSQGCCGALSEHAGRRSEAQRYARDLIGIFDRAGVETIVVNAAGCGSVMKRYGHLLAGERDASHAGEMAGRVRDVAEFLDSIPRRAERHPLPLRIAYHDACHLAHAQGVREQPRKLLAEIPGVELVEIADGELCCGSAGIYNLLQPDPARRLGDMKAGHVAETRADLLVSANPGCTMQIAAALARSKTTMPSAHTVQVLEASIAARPVSELTAGTVVATTPWRASRAKRAAGR